MTTFNNTFHTSVQTVLLRKLFCSRLRYTHAEMHQDCSNHILYHHKYTVPKYRMKPRAHTRIIIIMYSPLPSTAPMQINDITYRQAHRQRPQPTAE